MLKKLILVAFVSATMANTVLAQNDPTYRQFFFNPYLHNAAFVGSKQQSELHMFYRKQWAGIENAPQTMGVSLQIPTRSKVAIGLNLLTDDQVILKNNSLSATIGYILPVGKDQSLTFALSAGAGLNRFDFTSEELNTNDPAILNATGNTFNYKGNFGLLYHSNGLKIGFALTELFESDPFNEEMHNKISMRNLKNRLYSISYKFKLDPFENYSLEPYLMYKETIDHRLDNWEAAGLFYYKDKLWSGTSYNNIHGLALHFGMALLEKLHFTYSYEFPAFQIETVTKSSHELQLKMNIGQSKERQF